MSQPSARELSGLLEDGLSEARRRDFEESARICADRDRAHPVSLEGILDWIDQLRAYLPELRIAVFPLRRLELGHLLPGARVR